MFEDEYNIGLNTEIQNIQIREALIDYAESHYGQSSINADIFINKLEDNDFFQKAAKNLFEIIGFLYEAAFITKEQDERFFSIYKKFIFDSKRVDESLFNMRYFLIRNHKDLEVEENFSLDHILYNNRVAKVEEELKNYSYIFKEKN